MGLGLVVMTLWGPGSSQTCKFLLRNLVGSVLRYVFGERTELHGT